MLKSLSNLLSIILHPALLPTFATLIMFNTIAEYQYLSEEQRWFVYGFIFLITFILPISATPIYIGLGWVKSIYMSTHRERALPLIISSAAFYLAYYLLKKLQMNDFYLSFILFTGVLVFLTGIISIYWKISAHLTAMGGLVGLLTILALYLNVNVSLFLVLAILLSGVLASARLYLGAHSKHQVFAGFGVGFFIVFLGMMLSIKLA